MLLPQLEELLEYKIILASASVNRRNILKNAGLDYEKGHFEVSPSGFAEDLPKDQFPSSKDYVIKTSEVKLDHKVEELLSEGKIDKKTIVISADTIISMNNTEVMEKPKDAEHALEMITRLRDAKVHQVYTSVWIAFVDNTGDKFEVVKKQNVCNCTDVYFNQQIDDQVL